MYSETDIDGAVAEGVLSPATAAAFRAHVAAHRAAPAVDEESFRLITGFNDIFVSIAAVLLLVAVGWIGQLIPLGAADAPRPLLGLFVAATAWGLAEYFTRVRRMALPSIILLLAFVGGLFGMMVALLIPLGSVGPSSTPRDLVMMAVSAAVATIGAAAHWRRFRVPITIAAGCLALVGVLIALVASATADPGALIRPALFACGLGTFAFAMWWDMSDRTRQTRRSDVAFWLHLLAAPLIVHPAFTALAPRYGEPSSGAALVVIALYVALGLVALAIDRRALMVSALAYVLFAISRLFSQAGAVSLSVALTALVIGSALLLLSAFWQTARAAVTGLLPADLRDRLPPVGITPRPA